MDYVTSYAANAQIFWGGPSMSRTYADGTSNTIAFAEHYAYNCHGREYPNAGRSFSIPTCQFNPLGLHRPTFADGGPILNLRTSNDNYPVTSGSPPVTRDSFPGYIFQVAPLDCNYTRPRRRTGVECWWPWETAACARCRPACRRRPFGGP